MDEVLCKPRTYIIAQAENLVHYIVYTKTVRSIIILYMRINDTYSKWDIYINHRKLDYK
jgi:hypothetical protein